MNREIKFKAWYPGSEKEKGGWIQGFNMVNFHSYYNRGSEPNIYRYDRKWKLSEIIICQFTGLYDATKWESLPEENRALVSKDEWQGVPIYEGDIVSWTRKTWVDLDDEENGFREKTDLGVVEYRGHGFWIDKEAFGWEGESLWDWEQIQVIGNIHEHPQLLTPVKIR